MTVTAESDLVTVLLDAHRALERRMELLPGDDAEDQERLVVELLRETAHYGRAFEGHLDPLVRYLRDGAGIPTPPPALRYPVAGGTSCAPASARNPERGRRRRHT